MLNAGELAPLIVKRPSAETMKQIILPFLLICTVHAAPLPRDSLPLNAPEWPLNFRLHVEGPAKVRLCDDLTIALDANGPHDIAVEYPADGALQIRNCALQLFR